MATLCARGVRPLHGAGGRVRACGAWRRTVHSQNGPVRLSRLYVPTLADERVASPETIPSLRRLLRGGYVRQVCISRLFPHALTRQSASGTYSYLPLGLRMLGKISAIIDEELEHVRIVSRSNPLLTAIRLAPRASRCRSCSRLQPGTSLGASKRWAPRYVSAPPPSTDPAAVPIQGPPGRRDDSCADERGGGNTPHRCRPEQPKAAADPRIPDQCVLRWAELGWLTIVARKFRDEPRPRAGLLRTKEFLMKDLYSFDANEEAAQEAYSSVRQAYTNIFQRIFDWRQLEAMRGQRVWREAEADTGAMGGSFSHEYHVEDAAGEDTLLSCNSCGYAANSECAKSRPADGRAPAGAADLAVDLYLQPAAEADRPPTLVAAVRPAWRRLNDVGIPPRAGPLAEQSLAAPPGSSTSASVLVDPMCGSLDPAEITEAVRTAANASPLTADVPVPDSHTVTSLCLAEEGDGCPECKDGRLSEQRAIEVGHTFLLGTRYSEPLGCTVPGTTPGAGREPVQMGCYGIGITRILGALAQRAATLFDEAQGAATAKGKRAGFVWPASVAPFEALVLPAGQLTPEKQRAVDQLCTALHSGVVPRWSDAAPPGPAELHAAPGQVALDDRTEQSLGSRLYDADLMGYPIVFVFGKHWERTGEVEVRRAGQPTSYAVIEGVAL